MRKLGKLRPDEIGGFEGDVRQPGDSRSIDPMAGSSQPTVISKAGTITSEARDALFCVIFEQL